MIGTYLFDDDKSAIKKEIKLWYRYNDGISLDTALSKYRRELFCDRPIMRSPRR